ncbi:phosphotransferase [Sphingosinicella sp. BN140058]|uniref:phosphotransferase n=1 Tax=Sphingosinicella sp. BN140058 TaxID=1892855 RepID=UPI0010118281|nr:phosphotransferase [Sphingosinicella sp. BN140058]QAY77512.1 hypothetical protein ETR14_14115 [Sphingosinicella sp. BN140058]
MSEVEVACAALGLSPRRIVPFVDGRSNRAFHVTDRIEGDFSLIQLVGHCRDRAGSLRLTLDHLAAHDLPSHRPIALCEKGSWPWLLARFLPGESLARARQLPIEKIAALLARIHALAVPTHLAERRRRIERDWRHLVRAEQSPDLFDALARAEALRINDDRVLIHGDLFPDNLLADGALVPIDWEHAAVDHPLLDVAIAGLGILTHPSGDRRQVDQLFEVYRRISGRSVDLVAITSWIDYAAALLALHRYARARKGLRAGAYQDLLAAA